MTSSAKTIRNAIAAAISAAAVLATASIPAQAEYQRAPNITKIKKAKPAGRPTLTTLKKRYVLKCLASKGDVVAQALVLNTTGKILPIGRKIQWKATMANGSIQTGTYTLKTPLYAGQSRRLPQPLPWKFTCRAAVYA